MNKPNLSQYQQDFSLFIRKNANKKYHKEHLPQKNLDIYAGLIFNNINSALQSCFPICYSISEFDYWDDLVHAFIEEYTCASPMFRDIPEQFLEWLNKKNHSKKVKQVLPIYFTSFAHYEWVEMAIAIAPDNNYNQEIKQVINKHDWLNTNLVLSDAWTIVDYYYDVHLITKEYQPKVKKKQANYYLIFRNADGGVKFTLLNSLSVNLISMLSQQNLTAEQAIQLLVEQQPSLDKQDLLNTTADLLDNLYEQGFIFGVCGN
jgi:hypothetical protein